MSQFRLCEAHLHDLEFFGDATPLRKNPSTLMNIERPEKVSNRCLEVVQGATEELSKERLKFEEFVGTMFDELESAHATLTEQQDRLVQQRSELEVERDEFERAESRAQAELDTTRQQLDAANKELSGISSVFDMLESTQAELEESQKQLTDFREKAASFNGRIERENKDLKQQLQESTQEIGRLKALAEEQKQRLSDNRAQWTEELRTLRSKFESRTVSTHQSHTKPSPKPSAEEVMEPKPTSLEKSTQDVGENQSKPTTGTPKVESVATSDDSAVDQGELAAGNSAAASGNSAAQPATKQSLDEISDQFEFDFGAKSTVVTGATAEPESASPPTPEPSPEPEPEPTVEPQQQDAVLGSILAQFQQLESNVHKFDD